MYNKDVKTLETKYYEYYGKKLIGNDLCQFKDEYEKDGKCNSNIFIALGKKFYYSNSIKYKTEDEKYKISCKGIPLILLLKNQYNKNPEEIFDDLYNGQEFQFNNKNFDKVLFKHNKNLTITNNTDFNRKVKFTCE
jgi:hypothetical protein